MPGLAVGRLVETADRDRRACSTPTSQAGGVVAPGPRSSPATTSSPTRPNAVQDGARRPARARAPTLLITPNGKSPQDPRRRGPPPSSRTKLLGSRHDVIFLAGHFSANSALAADFTTSLLTTDLAASTVDLTNAIVFSAGCHAGYNLVDGDARAGRDAAARLGAGVRAEAGDAGRRHRLPVRRHRLPRVQRAALPQLRAASCAPAPAPVSRRRGARQAKLDYLATTPDIRGIHEKALLEATLFGLPMLGVNMPAGRGACAAGAAASITPVAGRRRARPRRSACARSTSASRRA